VGQPSQVAPAPAAAAATAPAAKPVEASGTPAGPVEPALSIGEVETKPTTAAPPRAPAIRAPAPPVRPAIRAKAPAPAPVPPVVEVKPPAAEIKPPAAEAKPPAKESCNPPYYFEGTKKIFKPNCL
jgi:hypothetical protein